MILTTKNINDFDSKNMPSKFLKHFGTIKKTVNTKLYQKDQEAKKIVDLYIQHLNKFNQPIATKAGQLALFGAAKNTKGLSLVVQSLDQPTQPKEQLSHVEKGFSNLTAPKVDKNKVPQQPDRAQLEPTPKTGNKLSDKLNQSRERNFFTLNPEYKDIDRFLGQVERLTKESAVMTLSAPQGAGKSTALFQLMDAFASSGYECLHASLEEHPESYLYEKKAMQYLSKAAMQRITAPNYGKENINQFVNDIEAADVVFIDSMKKLWQYIKKFDLDNDLRKKYDGKLFVIIFQLTSNGSMRGGTDAQFDGDIITFIEKGETFADNYAYHDKNRYAVEAISGLKYNVASKKLLDQDTNPDPGDPGDPINKPPIKSGSLLVTSIG